jgi:quercetin dioxygenase-like cupin family protein
MLKTILVALAATFALSGSLEAQQLPAAANQTATIKRTPLQKHDVPGTNLEYVMALAEIVPNVLIGKHTHPGVEGGYVLEGELTLMVDGQPPLTLKAGDSFKISTPGTPHDAKSGPNGAKVLANYVVEKGKPLASPAP